MRPERLFEILAVAERLKCNTRHSWTSTGRRESVAEHSWRLALMALLVADEFPDVDCGRVVRGLRNDCEYCGSENVDGITRITGYFTRTSSWNRGKRAELRDRRRNRLA